MMTKRLLLIAIVLAVMASLTGCRRHFCRDSGSSFRSEDACERDR